LEDEFDDAEEGAPECDPDDICEILDTFLKKREAQRNAVDNFGNPQVKKKSDFEDEEQEHERQKREEKAYWDRLCNVLSDRGHALWKALDKALTKYHGLLSERQKLIEDTGLLN
jgi:hypothetical protein